jgi:hypothetical protein
MKIYYQINGIALYLDRFLKNFSALRSGESSRPCSSSVQIKTITDTIQKASKLPENADCG